MSLARAIRASMLAGLVAAPVAPAMAEIQWNGFMSIGAGMTLDDEESFAGYDNDLSFAPDSVLGLQASADLGDKLSATGQLVGRGDSHEVDLEWAYLSYQATSELRFNVGRQRLPFYFYSDYLDVGYTYHFLRPPTSVYNVPLSSIDGVSLLYNHFVGSVEAKLQLMVGSYREDGADFGSGEVDFRADDYFGGILTLVHDDWLTFRASYHEAQLTLEGAGIAPFAALAQGGEALGLDRVAKAFTMDGVGYTFAGVGISAELNDYLLVAEATQTELNSSGKKEKGFYVSGGKRFGNIMPYVTLERAEVAQDSSLYGDIVLTSPGPTDPATRLRGGVQGYMNATDVNEYLYSVGMRYDFHPSAALKVQYTKVDDQREEGLLGATSRDANLISFSIDTVF